MNLLIYMYSVYYNGCIKYLFLNYILFVKINVSFELFYDFFLYFGRKDRF